MRSDFSRYILQPWRHCHICHRGQLALTATPGNTNALQVTAGGGGSYVTNNFVNLFTVTNTVGSITNYLDVGAATNRPARCYPVRLVP